jgi:hypothetical protein
MKQKIKIYRMPLSRVFPATHPRAGKRTFFFEKIIDGVGKWDGSSEYCGIKIHTIRADEKGLWKHRVEEVQQGNAVLVLFEWRGNPYSKDGTTNLFVFGASAAKGFIDELLATEKYSGAYPVIDSGIGTQEAWITISGRAGSCRTGYERYRYGIEYYLSVIAQNDGLSLDDFRAWFEDYDLSKPLTIIQFTEFRY